jgi:hypothetical protein
MVQVTFEIPERLLGEFYVEVGLALKAGRDQSTPGPAQAGLGQGGPGQAAPGPAARGQPEFGLHDWGTESFDREVAKQVWRKFSPRAQAVFSLLMDNPGVEMSADDIASKIGLSNGRHGLAGVVAWPSRQCASHGLEAPFRFEASGSGATGSYWMDADTAALFVAAREAYQARLERPATG